MEIRKHSDRDLIANALGLVEFERKVTCRLIEYLQEIEGRKLYAKTRQSSLYQFCSEFLRISEGRSYQLSRATTLSSEMPEIKEKLDTGDVNLATISKLDSFCRDQRVSKRETKVELLKEIEGKNSKECQRRLMELTPPESIPKREALIPVSPEHKRINITLNNQTVERLGRVRNLLIHKGVHTYGQTIEFMAETTLNKIDRTRLKIVKRESHNANPRQISESVKKQVWKRALGVCENCGSDYALEIDHVIPVAKGGGKELSNLRLLCRSCNRREAIESFGFASRPAPAQLKES